MTGSKIRCAVYTRKSPDDGLEQSFNSLDAQHESCAAYVASQRHEGWALVSDRFDDGGVSGGSLDRPALQRMLGEIDGGRVDMVVVYKIDRLTRSLADFAKLVERFDAAGCSFVSVTQAYNTASSMGRLTLNVLLSFAQFEREVTAERIRDKIAASKKQGLWMGGLPPLGYDPHPDPNVRELVINTAEAKTVQFLFCLYEEHGSLVRVEREAARLGLRSKSRCFPSGRMQGSGPLSRGQIYHILRNPIYLGRIRHKDTDWPGRHPAIVNAALWDRVQDMLRATSGRRRGRKGDPEQPAPLTGKLRDETGDRLTPTHTTKRGCRHRYYVSNRLISGGQDPTGWRLPGPTLEAAFCALIASHLERMARERRLLITPDVRTGDVLEPAALILVQSLRRKDSELLRVLVRAATVSARQVNVTLERQALSRALGVSVDAIATEVLDLSAPATIGRRGVEAKFIFGKPQASADPVLLRTLVKAHHWIAALRDGVPVNDVASGSGHHPPLIRTRGQLAFLSPKIQAAIRDGSQPPELSLKRLLDAPVPLDWDAQEKLYGL